MRNVTYEEIEKELSLSRSKTDNEWALVLPMIDDSLKTLIIRNMHNNSNIFSERKSWCRDFKLTKTNVKSELTKNEFLMHYQFIMQRNHEDYDGMDKSIWFVIAFLSLSNRSPVIIEESKKYIYLPLQYNEVKDEAIRTH